MKKGCRIFVKDNLVSELLRMGFDTDSANSMCEFENTEQTAYNIWKDKAGNKFVTIDLCCEVPIQCCIEHNF